MAIKIEEVLWDDLGITDASEEEKSVILNRLAETVQNRVAVRLGEVLTASELDTFDLTLERKGTDEAMKYVTDVYPNYQILVMEEVEATSRDDTGRGRSHASGWTKRRINRSCYRSLIGT